MKKLVTLFLIPTLLLSCVRERKSESQVEDIKNAFLLTRQEVSKMMSLPIEILPYERVELNAKVEGYVEKVLVDIGDRVHKGAVLVVLDAPELAARYAEASAKYYEAEAMFNASTDKYQRIRKASAQQGVIAEAELINSHNQMLADSASLISARSTAQAFQQLLAYLSIRAPFDGIVTERLIDPGDLVGSSGRTNLLTVERPDILRLRVFIPESYVNSVPARNELTFTTDAVNGEVFRAVLTRKSGSIDRDTRTELWEYEFDNRNGILKSGMFAMAEIELKRPESSFVVPYPAVVTTLEKKFVIRINDGLAEWVDVRDGIDTGQGIEIFGKLYETDTILARGSEELQPGTSVKTKIIDL
jgi:membrane fusion protein, multidrug efflux system